MKTIRANSTAKAWVKAMHHLGKCESREDFNVVLAIDSPQTWGDDEIAIQKQADEWLNAADLLPVNSVADLIFPAKEYELHKAKGVFAEYPDKVFPEIKEGWGTYAYRLVRFEGLVKKGTKTTKIKLNPLKECIRKMRKELASENTKIACYELPLYDIRTDRKMRMRLPCLSHLSFKITRDKRLNLTAIYRSHYYTQKALGNLVGLARLQAFVCSEAGLIAGELVCVSTLAKMESIKKVKIKTVKEQLKTMRAALLAQETP